MFDIMAQVPKLNSAADFSKFSHSLTRYEAIVISKINGLIPLADLALGLQVPVADLLEAVTGLLKNGLIHFEDPQVASLLQVKVAESRQEQRARKAAASHSKPAESASAPRPSVEKESATVPPAREGTWDLESVFPLITKTHRDRDNGILRLYGGSANYRNLFFLSGELIQVQSHPFDSSQCFGRILQRAGKLSQEYVMESLVRKKQTGALQGEELVKMGVIKAHDLDDFLARQIEVKLRDITFWKTGKWEFYADPEAVRRIVPVKINMARLLASLIWKNYDFDRIPRSDPEEFRARVIGVSGEPPYSIDAFGLADKLPKIWEALLKEDMPLEKLEAQLHIKGESLERFIWILNLCGMIVFLEHARTGPASARVKELQGRIDHIIKGNHFDTLGIHWNASSRVIQDAFDRLTEEHRQARINAASKDVLNLENRWFSFVQDAYDAIRSPESRKDYRKNVYGDHFIAGHLEFHRKKAESFLFIKEDYDSAIAELAIVIEIAEENAEFYSEYGLALFLKNHPRSFEQVKQARKYLQRGLELNAQSEMVNLCLGISYKAEKNYQQAMAHFSAVLALNPRNELAAALMEEIRSAKPDQAAHDQALKLFLEERDRKIGGNT